MVRRWTIFILGVIIVFSLMGNIYHKMASRPVDKKSKIEVSVEIPEGTNATKIAKILKDKDLIRNRWIFVSDVKESNRAHEIKAGKYKFSKSMTNKEMIAKLIEGKVYEDGIKIMFPEGSVSTEIVDKLVKNGLGSRKNYVNLFRNPKKFEKEFNFLKNPRIKTLEGFLYPETYFFDEKSSEEEIFRTMIDTFRKNYNKSIMADVEKHKYDFYDTVIMASIIEKESVNDEDRSVISGVFYNRLAKGMKLQSDAVLQ